MATQVETHTETTTTPVETPATSNTASQVMQKEKLQFRDLSKEIKESIVEKIIRPSHLKTVCLVNKELHEIAVRYLYRHVSLDLGSPNDNRLSAFLNPKNKGLKWIKQLRLYLATVYDKCNQEQQAQFATRMLLEFLPEDTLEEFRYATVPPDHKDEEDWCPWRPFSADNLILLYKKQRKMKWLEVMDLDRDVLPDIKKNPRIQESLFSNARRLALYPENRNTLNLSGYYIEQTRDKLEELIVHCNFPPLGERDAIDPRELNDSATGPGLLTNTLFSCMTPFDECTPFRSLTSVRLHRVNLRYCADTWCKVIKFHDIQYLRLYHCSGADSLFGQLSKASNLPKNLKVLEFQHCDNAENEALIALDGFLCLVSGLRDLVIDIESSKAMPASAGIARHGKTLEILNVHCAPTETRSPVSLSSTDTDSNSELVWDLDSFEKICTDCPGLEQLSCAWPSTSLIRSPSDEWKAFESACGNLRKLVTLHITTWPSNKPSTQLLPRPVYETTLQALAQRGFELTAGTHSSTTSTPATATDAAAAEDTKPLPPARLRLIAFGTSDKIYERENSKNQIMYLRSTCTDAEGKQKAYAAPLEWCARQFIEPRSEVLDFVLHQSDRSNKPPCKESREMSSWGDDDDV